jgi:ribosome-associated protein
MIEVKPGLYIDEEEIEWIFARSSGPGGQNVNKVETAVQLRYDVAGSITLPDEVKERLVRIAGRRMTSEGILLIEARRHRTRERNRQDALDRLLAFVERAAETPKPRKATRPSKASVRRRLEGKRRRGDLKRSRKPVTHEDA